MKIKGKVKVYHCTELNFDKIELSVKFKLPNQIFSRVRKTTIASELWEGREGREDYNFLEDAINKLKNKEYLKEVARYLIINYIEEKYEEENYEEKRRKLFELLKEVNNFEVEVEYNLKNK